MSLETCLMIVQACGKKKMHAKALSIAKVFGMRILQ